MFFWLCNGGCDFLLEMVESYFKDITYVDAGLSRFHLAVSASDLSPICHLLLGTVYLCLFSLIAEPDKLVQGLCLSSMLNHWNLARVCIGLDPKKHHWHNLTHWLIDWLSDSLIPYFSFLSSSHSSFLHFSFTGLFLFLSVCLCLCLSVSVCLSLCICLFLSFVQQKFISFCSVWSNLLSDSFYEKTKKSCSCLRGTLSVSQNSLQLTCTNQTHKGEM